MALTITGIRKEPIKVDGMRGLVRGRCNVTFDSSYPTGGESITPTNLSLLSQIVSMFGSPDSDANAYRLSFDYTNSKLMVFSQGAADAGDEVANTTDLSALSFNCEFVGS